MRFYKENAIFLLLFVFSLVFLITFSLKLNNLDYIWNYGFSAKISLGLVPYRDFNLLQTPLSFYGQALFLKIFGNYVIVYVVSGVFFIILMYYLFYRLLLELNHDRKFADRIFIFTAIYTVGNFSSYNYNTLANILALIIIHFEFNNRLSIKNNIIIGILFGLLFMTKQNISMAIIFLVSINILLCELTYIKKIKILAVRGLSFLIIPSLYVLYLYINNALPDFINYAFGGMIDFSNENKHIDPLLVIIYLLVPTTFIVKALILLIKTKGYNLNNRLFIVLTYAIGFLSMLYPMFDFMHVCICILLSFLLLSFIYPPEKIPEG